jgi:hypothetical protein
MADLFFKYAAIKLPEKYWIPKELSEHKMFKDYPHDALQKVFKDYGLDDFRAQVEIPRFKERKFEELYEIMVKYLDKANTNLYNLANYIIEGKDYFKTNYRSFFDIKEYIIENVIKSDKPILKHIGNLYFIILDISEKLELKKGIEDFTLTAQIKSPDGSIRFDKGMSIIKIYSRIRSLLEKLAASIDLPTFGIDLQMKDISITDEFRAVSKAKAKFTLVFSTELLDLLGISERGVQSCQSLHDEKDHECFRITDLNQKLIGTVLSRYVGVCYITDGRKSDDKGEQMLYRALIRQVFNMETNEPAIFIDKLYPEEETAIYDVMQKEIQKHSSIPVVTQYTAESMEYYRDLEEEIPREYQSYPDTPFGYTYDQLLKMKTMSPEYRQIAAAQLPVEDMIDMRDDPEGKVRERVMWRIPEEYLPQFIGDVNASVRVAVSYRIDPKYLQALMKDDNTYVRKMVATRGDKNILFYMIQQVELPEITIEIMKRLNYLLFKGEISNDELITIYAESPSYTRQNLRKEVMPAAKPESDNFFAKLMRAAMEIDYNESELIDITNFAKDASVKYLDFTEFYNNPVEIVRRITVENAGPETLQHMINDSDFFIKRLVQRRLEINERKNKIST